LRVRIQAENSEGFSLQSDIAQSAAIIQTVPDTPAFAVTKDEDGTSTTKITVVMPEIVSNSLSAGFTSIISYNL
jgi:hypothetical protein